MKRAGETLANDPLKESASLLEEQGGGQDEAGRRRST
jgi:hypothetical protein